MTEQTVFQFPVPTIKACAECVHLNPLRSDNLVLAHDGYCAPRGLRKNTDRPCDMAFPKDELRAGR